MGGPAVSVYFVYRCPYVGPTEKYIKKFDDATVLDWFRRHWEPVPLDQAWDHAARVLGTEVYSFGSVFETIAEESLPEPTDIEEVMAAVQGVYNNAICYEEHCIQILTDDDELGMVYYFFDDVFLKRNAYRAAYLLHEDWKLPDGQGKEGWKPKQAVKKWNARLHRKGAGKIYTSLLDPCSDACNYEDLDENFAHRIDGVRIPEFCQRVMQTAAGDVEGTDYLPGLREVLFSANLFDSPAEMAFVQAIRSDPSDEVNWAVYSDWLEERGERKAGYHLLEAALRRMPSGGCNKLQPKQPANPERYLIHVGDHVVQAYFHLCDDDFDQWFLFDDLWGSAHPALANSLIRWATRWDVLSTGRETRQE
jgi:uncharacterized protein (TIGR02996 family)